MKNTGSFTKLSPQGLLRQLSNCYETTCLQAYSNSVTWLIYIEQGKILYATHSVEPFDRLERQMRRLHQQIPLVDNEVRVQMRLVFEPEDNNHLPNQLPEYEAINWLVTEQHLLREQATLLIQELVKEVIESFILIKTGTYELTESLDNLTEFSQLDVTDIIEKCQNQLQNWRYLGRYISSPYQRPYLLVSSKFQDKRLPPLKENITNWMKGFSLRHLAIIMNQDELQLALSLYPYIVKGSIVLHEPDPPFDKLPKTCGSSLLFSEDSTELIRGKLLVSDVEPSKDTSPETPIISENNVAVQQLVPDIAELPPEDFSLLAVDNNIDADSQKVNLNTKTTQKTYKIISVDDSPTILKEISRYLEDENFTLVTINEPVKAVMSIIRHKPDLILLDLNMAGIDGYELCRIIRNNSMFKTIPIIFVTSNKGIIDKVKARFVGASGYLTKPFTRAQLLKMIFMHLA
ncbi:response regulator [Dolichospermum sp. ST_sed1]|nr:response regulator [Dolichospermum sp. ST_sed1]MDD1426967.1 response regulator [Dolichospermum sp. ST_sed9]MDD1432877.1 response regulator [Dolichospermum sp. ST_sed6]MDD1435487.1 response regulator [Dolichospermum sp. ST_sed10]MDD1444003.1 response regulator [Dolichospermum sp. ST_sed3]MDD1444932.1 response regulator [Dolichospermum sp. ST_sed8]MDD1456370.1 response regulator [Dolichospermum sp. ST_sed7]MDD1462931.1 response regulator [Dolichospermum sp. ST_sed2]MDD1468677.1 response re